MSYYPLSLWGWQDAIKAVFLDRVNIVSLYDTRCEPAFDRLPSVVSLKTYVKPSRHPAFTRFNVFLRDRFTCQYCGARDDLTFDHLVPRSKGGQTTWDNVVTACSPCNLRKGGRMPREVECGPPASLPAHGERPAPERPAVSAQLSARELDGLSLLGYGTGAVEAAPAGLLLAQALLRLGSISARPLRGAAVLIAFAILRTPRSSNLRPTICSPMGRPPAV